MEKEEMYGILQRADDEEGKEYERRCRLLRALVKTVEIPMRDTNYLDSTLRQRLGGIEGAGSWFEDMTEEELLEAMVSPDTELTEFTPEAAMDGCTYYKVPIKGKNGITNIEDLPEDSPLYLSITHAGTGRLSVSTTAKVPAKDEEYTTIILGQEEGIGEIMFTMHPGLPVAPSNLTLDDLKEKNPEFKDIIENKSAELLAEGKERDDVVLQITREQAKALGFDMAKLTSDGMAKRLEEQQIDVRNVQKKGLSLGEIRDAVENEKEQQKEI
ncbi:MAG: hypothetical protein IJ215_00035 [Clostridia bacterium]|nr:hypothetical protein [Clostridia bacterium]